MTLNRSSAKLISVMALIFPMLLIMPRAECAVLNDGRRVRDLSPACRRTCSVARNKFGGPTLSLHAVGAGPVAGNYINLGVEEGFGNWLEFGFTRAQHTNGGDPTISPLFNFTGMNIFNFKTKVLSSNFRGHKYLPTLSLGGVLRTNDPYRGSSH